MRKIKKENKPFLYRAIRVAVKVATAVFFQKIEVRNSELIPKRGPVLFVANHPNSIMDALVMGVVTSRKVNYIGHAGLFSTRFKRWLLTSSGVIPVFRREDAPEQMSDNLAAFEACFAALERGETIGIFPEGTSDMYRKVKRVKTGAARIVLEAERRNNCDLGVTLLPVGLYFFSRSRFRSRVLINIGAAIDLRPFLALDESDNVEAVQKLTAEIQRRLEKLTVNVRHEELDEFVRDVELLYRDNLLERAQKSVKKSERNLAEFVLAQKIAECVEYYYAHEPERVRVLKEKVLAYKRKLRRFRLHDAMMKENVSVWDMVKKSPVELTKVILGFPLAVYGTINNMAPYFITEQTARRFIDDRTKILSALLIGGVFAFLFFYAMQASLVFLWLGEWWAIGYLVSLPASGLFALAYIKELREERQRWSLSFFVFTNRQLFNRMRRERNRLIREFESVREEYSEIRKSLQRDQGYESVIESEV